MAPRLQRYDIVSELGQGGMSVVYRARDKQLPRDVAVKVLHEFLAKDADARRRFHREAVAVAKLHHPGIVEIFDYSGPDAEDVFIVTEIIEGVTLRELFEQKGRLAFPELGALVTLALCAPLLHAHQAGVIHRDLKPENVMVTRAGDLKLMDFGIAQMADAAKVTVTGTLLGSPAHMAPEVIDGARPDARSDLFSLGTMLYWLATGALPFEAANPSALFRRILEGEYPDPQQLEPRIGNGLAKIIRRAIDRDPSARYPDASSLAEDLTKEIELVGLAAPDVRALLADPAGFAALHARPVIDRLMEAGKAALSEGNVARAMDRLSRVLAASPDHAEARGLVARMGDREARQRRAKQAAIAAAVLGFVGASAYAVVEWKMTPSPPTIAVVTPAPTSAPAPTVAPSPTVAPESTSTSTSRSTSSPAVVAAASPVVTPRPLPTTRPSPTRASPSPIAVASATPTPIATPPPVIRAQLRVKIGGSFANVIIDEKLVQADVFGGTYALAPGRHTIKVEKVGFGGFLPKTLEVDASGNMVELRNGAREKLVDNEVRFRIPLPGAGAPSDWIPAGAAATTAGGR